MNISYRSLRSPAESLAAKAIVKNQYEKSGYTNDAVAVQKLEEKMGRYLTQSETKTFVALFDTTVFATVPFIPDGTNGLPLDELYQKEADVLRKQGYRLAEVSQLALDKELVATLLPDTTKHKQSTLILPLFSLILHYGLQNKFDRLCIAINPKHDTLCSALGFQTFGELKFYPSLNQAPAIAKVLNLKSIETVAASSFLTRSLLLPPPSPDCFQ